MSAMTDEAGRHIGAMISWEVITEKIEAQKREAETGADVRAVNQLLLALGRSRSVSEVITAALSSVREAFGWSYGSFWAVSPEDQTLRFTQDAGSVSDEFRRVTAEVAVPRRRGLERPDVAEPGAGVRARPGRDEDVLASAGRSPSRPQSRGLLPDSAG